LPGIVEIGSFFQESDMIFIGTDAIAIVEASEYGVEGQQGKAKTQKKDFGFTVFLQ
jgi:hypothetical protein